ncbi:hypothetical protein L9F63_001207, partial [Diploptera punctata]
SPCSCTVKKNGLDLLCEFTDQQHVSRAMVALKGTSEIIYYLKLSTQYSAQTCWILFSSDSTFVILLSTTVASLSSRNLHSALL